MVHASTLTDALRVQQNRRAERTLEQVTAEKFNNHLAKKKK
jgi:hypothetical protein